MKLRLRYFASLRESLGKSHEDISTDAQTVGQLRDQLLAQGGAGGFGRNGVLLRQSVGLGLPTP
jgi:molybdopterin converting factor small subunit